jgi:hypothetical protein
VCSAGSWRPLGALQFAAFGRLLHVEYFLVEYTGDAASSEGRPLVWGAYDEIRRRIKFENARELLRKAKALLDARSEIPSRP